MARTWSAFRLAANNTGVGSGARDAVGAPGTCASGHILGMPAFSDFRFTVHGSCV
jgi:hypothetical protein